jgi:hypothetical protein
VIAVSGKNSCESIGKPARHSTLKSAESGCDPTCVSFDCAWITGIWKIALTLVVVPVAYSYLSEVQSFGWRDWRRAYSGLPVRPGPTEGD